MGYSTTNKVRPLNIKFDIYSDSDDTEFKTELVTLMIGSLQELQLSAARSFDERCADIFKKAAHKAKSTLVLLDDNEFFDVVEELKQCIVERENNHEAINRCKIEKLNDICERIIESLEKEIEQLRAS